MVESLDDRIVPSTFSSIASNFNGTAIPAGSSVWFSSVLKVSGLGSSPTTLHVTGQTVSFKVNVTTFSLPVPDSTLTFSPSTTTGTTDFVGGQWVSNLPKTYSGNAFLGGFTLDLANNPYGVPNGLPGGIKPVTWSGNFSTDTAGVSLNWQWAAAVYRSFSDDYEALGVKPLDGSGSVTVYNNSDHAGTPENFKAYVTGGARGGGGSNYTGSYSGTAKVTPEVAVATPASLSGFVYSDENIPGGDKMRDAGDQGIAGVHVYLYQNDVLINDMQQTDGSGFYAFYDLMPGTYVIKEIQQDAADLHFTEGTDNVGTLGEVPPHVQDQFTVVLNGVDGTDYDFGELPPDIG